MASVYNSTPFIPSQGNAKFALHDGNFYQFDNDKWEDTKLYTSVILTVSCETPGFVKLRWTNSRETESGEEVLPGPHDLEDPLARDEFYYQPERGALTKQYDTRARWLNVWYDGSLVNAVDASLTLATVYKKAPTEIKFVDDEQNIVRVNEGDFSSNSLYTVVTDMSGLLINTTMEGQEGEALYVHLADASGTSLDTTYQYRDFVRADTSHYIFDNSVNNDDKFTIIPETNEFMVPTSSLGVKHGDIVKFIVLRDDAEPDLNALEVFDGPDISGHLKARGKVYYTRYGPSFTSFQILVDQDIGTWFTESIQDDYPNIILKDEMTTGDPNFVNDEYQLLTVCGDEIALVDDYYDIIQDPSGFNLDSITLGPGKIPLDLRFFKGMVHTTNRPAHIIVDTPYDPDLTLTTALRDNNNFNLSSTHIQAQDAWFFNLDPCEPVYPRVLFILYDGVYPGFSTDFSELFVGYVANMFNYTDSYFNQTVNSETHYGISFNTIDVVDNSLTGPCHAFLSLQDICDNTLFTAAPGPGQTESFGPLSLAPDEPPFFTTLIEANTYFADYLSTITPDRTGTTGLFDMWKVAEDIIPLIELYRFTDVVFLTPDSRDFNDPFDIIKDRLDHNPVWKGVNRYIIAPGMPEDILDFNPVEEVGETELDIIRPYSGESEDLLHFVDGDRDHILYYYPNINTVNFTVRKLQYETDGFTSEEATDLALKDKIEGSYLNTMWERLIHLVHFEKHEGHNALATHPSNAQGHSQAGTMPVQEASFPGVALHYALSDFSGQIIDTTKTSYGYDTDAVGNNALYVHLNNRQTPHVRCGESVDYESPLDVEFQGEYYDAKMFELTVSGPLTTLNDISSGGINVHTLSLVNESPTTVWVRLYDISTGLVESIDIDDYAMDLSHNVAFNFAVPHLNTREITFARPVAFENGLHFSASTRHRKEMKNHPPGNETIFVAGTYKPMSISLTEFLRRNQDADPDDFDQFEGLN